MKKRLGIIGAVFCCAVGTVHAGQSVCVFDLLESQVNPIK